MFSRRLEDPPTTRLSSNIQGALIMFTSRFLPRRFSILVLSAPVLLLCNACGGSDSSDHDSGNGEQSCRLNSDCPSGYSCQYGQCNLQRQQPVQKNYCSQQSSDDVCDRCIKSSCCSETQACGETPACQSLSKCIANCSTNACYNTCESNYPGGVSSLMDLLTCVSDSCTDACS